MIVASLFSWLPSGLTLALSGLLLLGAIAGLVYQRLPAVPYRSVVLIAAGAALYASAWTAGAGNARAVAERQALEAMIAAKAREVAAQKAQIDSLAVDAQVAQQREAAAEARADAQAAVAETIPTTRNLSSETSDKIRDLWK